MMSLAKVFDFVLNRLSAILQSNKYKIEHNNATRSLITTRSVSKLISGFAWKSYEFTVMNLAAPNVMI